MSPFTACIVQTTSLPYDKQGNLDRALRAMEAAAARREWCSSTRWRSVAIPGPKQR